MQDDLKLLDMMVKDQLNQRDMYRPGPYWKRYSSRITKAIHADGLQDFRSNSRIGKGYTDTVLMNPFDLSALDSLKSKVYKRIVEFPSFKRHFVNPYIRHIEKRFQQTQKYKDSYYTNMLGDWFSQFSKKYSLPDTLIEKPQDTISIHNYRIGMNYLTSFLRIHNYSKIVDFSKVKSVFEIGGGFGAFCHTLLQLFPNIRKYLYLDIPPILYVSTQYLKHLYKDEIIDYRQTRDLNSIHFSSNDTREIIAICPWQIEKTEANIDLFWNSASFQEMTKGMVINYTRHIGRMLRGNDSKLCLYVYKGGRPEKTLLPKELLGIIENNISVVFKELKPEVEIRDAHYFLGYKP